MKYVWDENKRKSNRKKHGLDFSDAPLVFEGVTLTFEDDVPDYNEKRFKTLGLLGTVVVVIVHTESEEEIRVISMRKADSRERRAYEEAVCI
jgi:uncharacterized DUF497 family protein